MDSRMRVLTLFGFCVCNSFASIYTPVSQIRVSVPQTKEAYEILRNIPLLRVNLKELYGPVESVIYDFDSHNQTLTATNNGDIYIGAGFTQLEDTADFVLGIRSNATKKVLARVTISVTPIEVKSVKDFCQHFPAKLCFWDNVLFHIAENNHKLEVVGPLSSGAYKKMCTHYSISYRLVNGFDFFTIDEGLLTTIKPLDYEKKDPGPQIHVTVECSVHSSGKLIGHVHNHTFLVSLVDQNDNGPKLQDEGKEKYELIVNHQHFRKTDELRKNDIMFVDNDSRAANNQLRFIIQNDLNDLFVPTCTFYTVDDKNVQTSYYHCKIEFKQESGTIPTSPYCFLLNAIDDSVLEKKDRMAVANICIRSNDVPAAPRAEPLQGSRDYDSSEDTKRKRPDKVSYPPSAVLFKSATNLSRVVQPLNFFELFGATRMNYNFQIRTAIEGLNITRNGGIIYVSNAEKLGNVMAAIYELNVTWANLSNTIKLHVKDGNSTCITEIDPEHNYCSRFFNGHDCLRNCAPGSATGACEWRQPIINSSNLQKNYGTCSPSLQTCPDRVCDPLEEKGQKRGIFVCPQDCTDSVSGSARRTDTGRGIYSGVGVCKCDDYGKCTCMNEAEWKRSEIQEANPVPIAISSQQKIMHERSLKAEPYWIFISCTFVFIGVLVAIMFFIGCYRQKSAFKKKLKEQELIHDKLKSETRVVNIEIPMSSNEKFKFDLDAKWEMKRENIELQETIGEGEFGKVVRGFASQLPATDNTKPMTVAVKMLKTGANHFELLALMSEYQMLQDLSHPNVIKLLGACTTAETPLLIIEYCHFGSLKNYLRTSRNVIESNDEEKNYQNQIEAVTEKDVLSFAWQVCKGMAYLADMKLVHRDLAARNVLVAEGKVCKISDFGLTRDIYEDDAYLKKSKDRVPVKWMAPESLSDQVYTSKSDVWAFGVLCWEIITLGASPYPAVPLQNLYSLLMSGYRMAKPNNCSEKIFGIIQSCWVTEPQQRPSFDKLMKKWEDLMLTRTQYLDVTTATETEGDETNSVAETAICDEERWLWMPPTFIAPGMIGIDNRKYFVDGSADQAWQMGYDMPKQVMMTDPSAEDSKLRYENIKSPTKKRYSQPDITITSYDTPMSNKRVQSYLEMDKVDPHIQNNLSNEMKDNMKDVRQISFTFVNN